MKTTPAKRLAREKTISVKEAKRQLDAEANLKEQWQWTSSRLQQEYLCQMMFHHATGKSEQDCAICWGRWEPSAEQDVEREPTTMELFWPDSSQEDIVDLYCDVYQLQRLLGKILCDKEMGACICQEILDSVKEHLWCKWLSTLLGADPRQSQTDIPRLDLQVEFNARNCATYDRFMDVKWDSCKEALAMARDAHQWTLVAAALLDDKIERSHSLSCSCWQSRSCRHSGSHQQRRSQTADHQTKVPQARSHHGDPAKRWVQSPSPSQSRQQVTFAHSSFKVAARGILVWKSPTCQPGGWKEARWQIQLVQAWGRRHWVPAPLEPHVQEFLRGKRCFQLMKE